MKRELSVINRKGYMSKVAVIILNWNGEKLLKEFLPAVVAHTHPGIGRVVVADNGSSDGSVRLLEEEFPGVELIRFQKNYGFAGGYNRAIKQVGEEIVVLLNSDVEVAPGWLEPLVDLLDARKEVVAVQPKILSYKRRSHFEYAGACGGYIDWLGFPFCRGRLLDAVEEDRGQYDGAAEVFWCSGAALCVRREAYLHYGGLDERFFAHMEEIDFCWRLRNQGRRLMVEPRSVVYHLGGGSLPMEHPHKLFLNYRNNLLMLYKNLDRSGWRRVRLFRCPLDAAAMFLFLVKGQWANVKAVYRACREFRKLKKEYRPAEGKRTDNCILRKSIVFHYYFRHVRKFSELWK